MTRFANNYLAYEIAVNSEGANTWAKLSLSFGDSSGVVASGETYLDLNLRDRGGMRLIVNSMKPNGDFVSEIRLACSLQ